MATQIASINDKSVIITLKSGGQKILEIIGDSELSANEIRRGLGLPLGRLLITTLSRMVDDGLLERRWGDRYNHQGYRTAYYSATNRYSAR